MEDIAARLHAIKNKIILTEEKYYRPPASVQLLAASKGQSVEKIAQAYAAGQRIFGENYLQEALQKQTLLKDKNDIEWHYIGTIQHNKTRKIAEHFSWVHSISDKHTLDRLSNQRPSHLPPINICIEVNISHEVTKSGVDPVAVLPLAEYCQSLGKINLRGLMTIPSFETDFTAQRENFHKLLQVFQKLQTNGFAVDTLSMGMSHDFEAAIAEGATIVRIGSAIFGARGALSS